jgi:FkbM family methyltransferase
MNISALMSDFMVVAGGWLRSRSAYGKVVTPFFAGVLAGAKLGKKVNVVFDGQDWVFRWDGGGAVQALASFDPRRTYADNDLYFQKYTLNHGDTVAIIGVENGAELPFFCEEVGPSGRVFAVEPDPSCFRRLTKLKKMLGLSNLELVNAAVGGENGYAWLTQADAQGTTNSILNDVVAGDRVKVPLKTLHDLFSELGVEELDYVKMNIEGAEIQALGGFNAERLSILNWCISCHDFIAVEFRSYEFVKNWLQTACYRTSRFSPTDSDQWWRNYYLYGAK